MALNDTITALGNSIINLIDKKTPIATANTVGMVKPDGSTINIDANGVISSNGGGGSGLEVCDIGMALYVDETKGLRRYLNGQIVDRNDNTEAFFTRLQEITTLHSSLLCTEEEWQAAKTMSVFGQVGKFVFNYSDDAIVSVRLPRVVNVQGLFDLQNLGMTVGAGLPTHTHTRGTMEISGNIYTIDGGGGSTGADGAFAVTGQWQTHGRGTNNSTHSNVNFYASRSWTGSTSAPDNSIYGKSNTVQQEAIQYPYFIQIATGAETENNIINEIELNNPYGLFDFKWADHELNNISWTRADNFDWKSSATYPSAYNELLAEYNNAESVEETEGTVTFKRTPKGYKIALSTQETAILNKYNTDGIAWYYILDTTNTQFKLPRTKYGFEGLRTNVGDKIDESLPNIKAGTITISDWGGIETQVTGAWEGSSSPNSANLSSGNTATEYFISFNASRSSSTYKDGAPVQERATQMYLYFYVGETVQNAKLIDAGRIGETLANKADIDGSNMVASVKNFGSKFYRKVQNLSNATAQGTYTLDFSSYLPNDNKNYYVLISGHFSGVAGPSWATLNGSMFDTMRLGHAQNGHWTQYHLWVPVGIDRRLNYVIQFTLGSDNNMQALGYVRMGYNQ